MSASPVTLEVYRHLFAALAEEMGVTLRRTAISPNITERRDYSCALFDGAGRMVAQGENIPVHLGSMPASVAAAIAETRMERGDIILLNDPFRGGTHLPDLPMVAPWFGADAAAPAFFLAVRAHHADIGGATPGSMPIAGELLQEGLVIPPVHWVRAGVPVTETHRLLLANVRTPIERTGDLDAQAAALAVGKRRLADLVRRRGEAEVMAYGQHLLARAERSMRALIASLPDGTYRFEDVMEDDGCGGGPFPLVVAVTVEEEVARVDFTGTGGPAGGGINAVPAIANSAVYYAFRTLLDADAPSNAGLYAPLDVIVSSPSLLDPPAGAAVAGGNVETSQRLVDVVLGALAQALPDRVAAASQGTMNNVAFGGVRPGNGRPFTYYETLAGGHGGRPDGPGMSARHSHMTNSLNTPVEAIEHALPVRVERYAIRHGSGGAGRYPGGAGLVREYLFLADAELTLITERRARGPWGLAGGSDGAPGRNTLVRADTDREERLGAKCRRQMAAGDRLIIETPGGGGWGAGGSHASVREVMPGLEGAE
ncbi:MAG: hydantoinase B/oxoprolinase family protein [Acidobacteriota bacterium]